MSDHYTEEEKSQLKQAIFDNMSPRRQKHILKKGYDKWDPFMEPKDPIDIRKDSTRRTTQTLIREFLQSVPMETYSSEYARGAFDMALGIVNKDEKFFGMYDFSLWYSEILKKDEGLRKIKDYSQETVNKYCNAEKYLKEMKIT